MKCLLRITLLLAFVVPAHAVDYTWDGNGDVNRGGNWSTAANWNPDGVPDGYDDTAQLPVASGNRYVTNDVATAIQTLTMATDPDNLLWLESDLTVSNLNGTPWQAWIYMNGNTLTISAGGGTYLPGITGGDGRFVKIGPDSCYSLNSAIGYTGDYVISNGLMTIGGGNIANGDATSITIHDGARVRITYALHADALPPNAIIYGNGGGLGAFDNGVDGLNLASTVTVASAAMIVSENNLTLNLNGPIVGTGESLTLNGNVGGDFVVANTNSTYAKKLIVTNGSVLLTGALPDITNIWVDAGGVFEGLQSQFPLASVVETNGGVWLQPTSATWTGGGDGSNWTDTANWAPQIIPSQTATISIPGSPIVVVDVSTNVDTLAMAADGNIRLRLDADLTVSNLNAHWEPYIEMNGHTLTVWQRAASQTYMPALTGGGGVLVKVGPGTLYSPNSSIGYSGDYIISNGLFVVGGGVLGQGGSTNLTVHDGATVQVRNDLSYSFPSNVYIYGDGGTGDGAIRNANQANFYPDVIVAADALIYNASALTFTLYGDLFGPGDLTLESSTGDFDLDGTYNFTIDGNSGNRMIIDSGVLNVEDCTLAASVPSSPKALEYVLIDYSGGSLEGAFAATNELPDGWVMEYAGTTDNANCVVLIPPPQGSVIVLR